MNTHQTTVCSLVQVSLSPYTYSAQQLNYPELALNDPIQHFVLDYVSRRQNLAHTSSAPVIKQQLIH